MIRIVKLGPGNSFVNGKIQLWIQLPLPCQSHIFRKNVRKVIISEKWRVFEEWWRNVQKWREFKNYERIIVKCTKVKWREVKCKFLVKCVYITDLYLCSCMYICMYVVSEQYVVSLLFASVCYFLITRPMLFNILFMLVFLFCMFVFYFVYSVLLYCFVVCLFFCI